MPKNCIFFKNSSKNPTPNWFQLQQLFSVWFSDILGTARCSGIYCLVAARPHKNLFKQWLHFDGFSSLILNLCFLDKSFDFRSREKQCPGLGTEWTTLAACWLELGSWAKSAQERGGNGENKTNEAQVAKSSLCARCGCSGAPSCPGWPRGEHWPVPSSLCSCLQPLCSTVSTYGATLRGHWWTTWSGQWVMRKSLGSSTWISQTPPCHGAPRPRPSITHRS